VEGWKESERGQVNCEGLIPVFSQSHILINDWRMTPRKAAWDLKSERGTGQVLRGANEGQVNSRAGQLSS